MALTRQFFQTPTGRPYQPARDIERSFDKTSMLIGGAMQRESDRLKQEEAAFGQLYNNIGELEGNLMQNYAGIEQQAIQSTRDFVKEHLKKGGRVSDPEFQLQLGERTGRIKAAMSNAERNREALKAAADTIKNDPTIIDKATAMTSLMSRMNDPDFLISKNPFDVEGFLDGFVNPQKVFESVLKNLPTDGEFTDEFYDDKGNLRTRTLLVNPLVSRETPFDESGRPNITITDDFARSVASGEMGNRVLQQAQRIADERYPDLPRDVAFKQALKDGMGSVMGINYKEGIKKSARDIQREQEADRLKEGQLARQNKLADLAYARELRLSGQENENQETLNRWDKFVEAVTTGDDAFLGDYAKPSGKIDEVKVVSRQSDPLFEKIQSKEVWDNLDRDERIEIIESLGLKRDVPKTLGAWETKDPSIYQAVKEKFESAVPELSIEYKEKVPKNVNESGSAIRNIPIKDPSDIEKAFRMFEQLRGKNPTETKVGKIPKTTTKKAPLVNIPEGGFN